MKHLDGTGRETTSQSAALVRRELDVPDESAAASRCRVGAPGEGPRACGRRDGDGRATDAVLCDRTVIGAPHTGRRAIRPNRSANRGSSRRLSHCGATARYTSAGSRTSSARSGVRTQHRAHRLHHGAPRAATRSRLRRPVARAGACIGRGPHDPAANACRISATVRLSPSRASRGAPNSSG